MPKLQQIESHVHIRCVFSCQVGFIWLERYLPNLTLISSTPFFLRWSSSLQSCPGLDAGPTPASFAGGWWSSLPVWKKNFNSSASTSESSWIIHGEWVPELPSNEAPSTAGGASTYPCILLSQELRNKYCVESKRNWYNAPPSPFFLSRDGARGRKFAFHPEGMEANWGTKHLRHWKLCNWCLCISNSWNGRNLASVHHYIYIYSTSIVHPQKPIKNKGHENMGHENYVTIAYPRGLPLTHPATTIRWARRGLDLCTSWSGHGIPLVSNIGGCKIAIRILFYEGHPMWLIIILIFVSHVSCYFAH